MSEFIAVILITILAVMSPGADFAIVTQNSYLYGRKIGILTAVGIACGVLLHVIYTLIAIFFFLQYTSHFLNLIKFIGAIYLIYIGYKTFTQEPIQQSKSFNLISVRQAIRYGFLTNALNPKTTLFVISTYTQIVSISTPTIILIGYGLFMGFAHFVWFALVSIVFSSKALRKKMLDSQVHVNKVIGIILCILGCSLLFTHFH